MNQSVESCQAATMRILSEAKVLIKSPDITKPEETNRHRFRDYALEGSLKDCPTASKKVA